MLYYMRLCGRDTSNAVKGIALATRKIMASTSRSSCRGGSPVEFPKYTDAPLGETE